MGMGRENGSSKLSFELNVHSIGQWMSAHFTDEYESFEESP